MTCATALLGLDPFSVPLGTGSSIRSFDGGAGETVVLLHGLGGSAANWAEVVDRLVPGRRVLAVDLPGHGGSDPLPRGAVLDDYADAVAGAIEGRDGAPALVVGHSFGGQVALRLAVRHPRLVRGLVLVVSSGVASLPRRTAMGGWLTTAVRPGRLLVPLARRYADRTWFRTLAFRPLLVADAAAFPPRAVLGFFAGLREHRDVRGAFRALLADTQGDDVALGCPALVLWGADDGIVPAEHGMRLARLLQAPLRVVADCGHLVIGERPGAVVDAIRCVLQGQTGFSTSMNS
jgi:(E)-2-((N-methylformamido)methylene)succinate hydrolase